MSAPRIKDQLNAITARGGRVVVVDPRRSETAREFEHLAAPTPTPTRSCCCRCCRSSFAESLEDAARARRRRPAATTSASWSRRSRRRRPRPRPASSPSGSARSPATSPPADGAAIYGRTGSCLGRNGTLVSFLLDALALATGNLDSAGGSMFGEAAIPFERVAELIGAGDYGKRRSRVGGFPEVLGAMPATLMAKEITTPGRGPDAGAVRLRRQPGAERPQRRGARGGDAASSTSASRSTST